jgi:hypothetical protein
MVSLSNRRAKSKNLICIFGALRARTFEINNRIADARDFRCAVFADITACSFQAFPKIGLSPSLLKSAAFSTLITNIMR